MCGVPGAAATVTRTGAYKVNTREKEEQRRQVRKLESQKQEKNNESAWSGMSILDGLLTSTSSDGQIHQSWG